MFLMAGGMKATKSKDELKEAGGAKMAWVDSVSANNVKLIGVVEVLIALGLILPQVTGILPWLTPLAAVGFVCTMLGATALHIQRGESPVTNIVLLLLAAFVAYGRFVLIPA
ncbi:MAG: hypothetical protein ACI9EW_000071 [Cellvibrionaceae bacterium]|jgi:hypothetical protein